MQPAIAGIPQKFSYAAPAREAEVYATRRSVRAVEPGLLAAGQRGRATSPHPGRPAGGGAGGGAGTRRAAAPLGSAHAHTPAPHSSPLDPRAAPGLQKAALLIVSRRQGVSGATCILSVK